MRNFFAFLAISVLAFSACSNEEPAPLPPLKPVAVPQGIVGFYSGQLPCDECKARLLQFEVSEDSSVLAVRTTMNDTAAVDTLRGSLSMNGDTVSVSLSEKQLNFAFVRSSIGNLTLLNGAREVYVDADGQKFDMVKIFAAPKRKNAKEKTE
mgnify:CR=1 FL=1